jgi:capsular polysaccharide biosynthesis protein
LLRYTFKNEQDQAFFEHRFSGYEVHLKDVLLDGTNGWVVSGRNIHSLSFFNINDPYDGKKRYPPMLPMAYAKLIRAPTETGEVVWLPKLWNNYYHFVVELLPVLLALKRIGKPVTVMGCSVTVYPYVQYFVESMQLQPQIRFTPIEKGKCYKAKSVLLKKQPLFEKEYQQAIQQLIASIAATNNENSFDKVFVYRKGLRSLENNQAVLECLTELGFYCFDPGDHPVSFQVAALADASVVVGVHGAGLTNILFSSRLRFLLELMPGNMKPNHYREIAVTKGASYSCLQGSMLNENLQFNIETSSISEALSKFEK